MVDRKRSTTAFGDLMARLVATGEVRGHDAKKMQVRFDVIAGEFLDYAKNPWVCTLTAPGLKIETRAPTGAEALLKIVEQLERG